MTPDPNSPCFISHEIPDSESESALRIKDISELLRANLSALVWLGINEKNLVLTFNTYTGDATVDICFTDANNHTQHFFVKSMGLRCVDSLLHAVVVFRRTSDLRYLRSDCIANDRGIDFWYM